MAMEDVGLTATLTTTGMPLLMPPSMPPALLVSGDYLAVFDGEGVIVLRAFHARRGETGAELHALDGRDGQQGLGQLAVQGIEDRLAQAGRHVEGDAFDDAAEAVPRLLASWR